MHRTLRPGGRAVAAVWGRRDRCGSAGSFPGSRSASIPLSALLLGHGRCIAAGFGDGRLPARAGDASKPRCAIATSRTRWARHSSAGRWRWRTRGLMMQPAAKRIWNTSTLSPCIVRVTAIRSLANSWWREVGRRTEPAVQNHGLRYTSRNQFVPGKGKHMFHTAAIALLLACSAYAQSTGIQGVVQDESGAMIPGVDPVSSTLPRVYRVP